jgi:hypothetical protein
MNAGAGALSPESVKKYVNARFYETQRAILGKLLDVWYGNYRHCGAFGDLPVYLWRAVSCYRDEFDAPRQSGLGCHAIGYVFHTA